MISVCMYKTKAESMKSKFLNSSQYVEDLIDATNGIDLNDLYGKTVMISGATGMVGTFLIDALMLENTNKNAGIKIIALGRSIKKANERFPDYIGSEYFSFFVCDITKSCEIDVKTVDYIIHAASTTHPIAYATMPVETITSNILGALNLFEFGRNHGLKRFVFLSSVEVYGENRGDVDEFSEDYCGYIDSNSLRAGYPEVKRVCESLCQAYRKQYGINALIVRFPRLFGPTMLMSDTKASSQFLKNGINGEDIVLKSRGLQYFSYLYVSDAVSALLAIMVNGRDGEAYNVASHSCNTTLRDFAFYVAECSGTKVVFQLPSETESAGYSKASKAILDGNKLSNEIGWTAKNDIQKAISKTLKILHETVSH